MRLKCVNRTKSQINYDTFLFEDKEKNQKKSFQFCFSVFLLKKHFGQSSIHDNVFPFVCLHGCNTTTKKVGLLVEDFIGKKLSVNFQKVDFLSVLFVYRNSEQFWINGNSDSVKNGIQWQSSNYLWNGIGVQKVTSAQAYQIQC